MPTDLLVIDTLSHGPLVWNDSLVRLSDEMLEAGENPFRIGQELMFELAMMVASDEKYFEQYSRVWDECGVSCVSWTLGAIHEQPYSLDAAYHNYAYMTHMIENRKGFFLKVLKAADIEQAHNEGRPGIIFNFQNLDHIGTNLDLLDRFYQMGFRIMQLTYNMQNSIGCGCTEAEDPGPGRRTGHDRRPLERDAPRRQPAPQADPRLRPGPRGRPTHRSGRRSGPRAAHRRDSGEAQQGRHLPHRHCEPQG